MRFAPLMLAALLLLTGCASQPAPALSGVRIPADQYAKAFQAARETLRDARFTLERVDAPQGVITSRPKSEPGLAKAWEAQSGFGAAVDDTLQRQERTIEIAFVTGEPTPPVPGQPVLPRTDPDRDLTENPSETTLLVRVSVSRTVRDSRQISPDSVRMTRQARDPQLDDAGLWPAYLVPAGDDPVLAAAVLQEILRRIQ